MSNIPVIAHVVFDLPLDTHFDYLVPEHCAGKIAVGSRVLAVFARRKRVGVVVSFADQSTFPDLNAVIRPLDEAPAVDMIMLAFAHRFADRFCCSLGQAIFLLLPTHLRLARVSTLEHVSPPALRDTSARAVSLVMASSASGRWEGILPRIKETLAADRGVLVLLPETSYLEDTLPRLAPLAQAEIRALLRTATDKDEYERWRKVRSGQARLVVGFVSAVFAPVQDLGLMVMVDEESPFYKTDQSPFYHARSAAELRAAAEGAELLFVSGAPSLTLMRDVREGRVAVTENNEFLPPVRCLDLANFKMKKGTALSSVLSDLIQKAVAAGGRVLVYVQASRGVGPLLAELALKCPQVTAAGYDRTSKELPTASVIVGTQSIFRHRASFRPALAALPDLDWELYRDDLRAAHGVFVLLRTLRQMATAEVVIQTRQATSPLLPLMIADDPSAFYDTELAACEETGLPPYGALAIVVARSRDPLLVESEARRFYDLLQAVETQGVTVSEPQVDRSAILRGRFRRRIMVQGPDALAVASVVRQVLRGFRARRDTIVTVDVDS